MTFLKAKQSLGQNFLVDEFYISKIIESFEIDPNDVVLEIGPGKGVLTQNLLNLARKVYAVEIDQRMYEYLNSTLAQQDKLRLLNEDFLKFNFEKNVSEENVKIIGNLPYHITSAIIFKIVDLFIQFKDNPKKIKSLTIMTQKEVAERIVAKPNNKQYGVITALTDLISEKEILFDVPKEAFRPIPKVTSSIIKFEFTDFSKYEQITDYSFFKKMVKAAFRQRRKMLRKSLKFYNVDMTKIKTTEMTKRPENLSVAELIALANEIKSLILN